MKKFILFLFSCQIAFTTEIDTMCFLQPSHPLLKQRVEEVPQEEICSAEVQEIIDRMYVVAKGERIEGQPRGLIGLAAPQIGINKRIVLVDIGFDDETRKYGNLQEFINPKIVWASEEMQVRREGCFSVDSRIGGVVYRPLSVKIEAYDRKGNLFSRSFSGIVARIFQHEYDHLEGFRFPDRIGEDGTIHWVDPEKLLEYRSNWQNWPVKCPWEVWVAMKEGREFSDPENSEP